MKMMSPRKGRKVEIIAISPVITQCLSIMIICLALPLTLPYSFPDGDEQPIADQLQKIHQNAQAIPILTSSIDKEEIN
jgi:hypothetical protein